MSDANKPINKKDKKRIEAKRGIGVGSNYCPFILVGEFSSSGESIRVKSVTIGRIHHFHSGIELAAFLVFDRYQATVDIREQYPLPLKDTLAICRQLGIRHPQTKGELHIVTTDLLIDLEEGKQIAIAVKNSCDLEDERILEKLQIEKAFWEDMGVCWYVFTERDVSEEIKANLKWLRPFLDIDIPRQYELNETDVLSLRDRIQGYPNNQITKLCGQLDDEYGLEPGFHIEILRFAVAHGYFKIPMNKHFTKWICSEVDNIWSSADWEGADYAS